MMSIRRVFTVAAALALFSLASPALIAQNNQNNQQNRRDQERRSQQEQQDIQALVRLVDAVSMGQQPAPADIGIRWESSHFVKGSDGSTYIPFTVTIDKTATPGVAMYVRVVNKGAAAPAPAADANAGRGNNNRNQQQQQAPRVTYPWDNVHFLDVPTGGKVSRAMALKPGEYEAFIAVKEKTTGEPPRNAPPPKMGLLRRDITVPDFGKAELSTSSVIVASAIEPVTTALTAQQQQENPYTFGSMRVVPSPDMKMKKSGELQVLFWIYGAQPDAMNKPDVTVEYNFHQKTAEGEKYFNKTAPQALNAMTLPPEFNMAAGHQLPGSLVVPLMSFPVGDYRLEIKITDKLSGKTLTQNATFTVES
jgi:hypothetical protein